MGSYPVNLPRPVSGKKLERACIEAAEDLGYKAKTLDEYRTSYSLRSVHRNQDYNETNVRIGNLMPLLQVRGIKKGREQDRFFIYTGFPHGFGSEAKIQKYLSEVSRHL